MKQKKQQILEELMQMVTENARDASQLLDRISLNAYSGLTWEKDGHRIWTEALQTALREHEVVQIPAAEEPYWIDNTVLIPSNRRIEAQNGAVIRLCPETDVLMFRNVHASDGSLTAKPAERVDCNISIDGGRWEESRDRAVGYGKTGKFDAQHSVRGVFACMHFNNLQGLTLTNMTFAHAAGFSVQIGNIVNFHAENISFDNCFFDGIHINGNTERVVVRHIHGKTGDDLVALNMCDWENSATNFGPIRKVLCEDLEPMAGSSCKAFRILPGIHIFPDGSQMDCSAEEIIIRKVRGINEFKLYWQTPGYSVDQAPATSLMGHGDWIFFEDVEVVVEEPPCQMENFMQSNPVSGNFGAFEVGSNIGNLAFSNVRATLNRKRFPRCQLLCVGPKSARDGNTECFDPYVQCQLENLWLEDIQINGEKLEDCAKWIHEVDFENLYADGPTNGKGKINKIISK